MGDEQRTRPRWLVIEEEAQAFAADASSVVLWQTLSERLYSLGRCRSGLADLDRTSLIWVEQALEELQRRLAADSSPDG